MPFEEQTGYCKFCEKQVMVRRKGCNNILHFVITIILAVITSPLFFIGGVLWFGIWVLDSIKIGGWRCTNCGQIAKKGTRHIKKLKKQEGSV